MHLKHFQSEFSVVSNVLQRKAKLKLSYTNNKHEYMI